MGGTSVALLHGVVVLILARFADVPITFTRAFQALGLMAVVGFVLTSLGIIITNRVRTFEGFGVFSNAIILPLYFTSSSIFPLDPSLTRAQAVLVFPDWLVTVMHWNPLTYAVDALRAVLIDFHQFPLSHDLLVIGGMAVVTFTVALWDFGKA